MPSTTYLSRRGQLADYFDRTAAEAWSRLTSDAPVSRIRETVRQGRDGMRATLMGWLPEDMTGRRLLDAGCGTGLLAIEAARRGADVVAVDLAHTLLNLARERLPDDIPAGRIQFIAGDFLDPGLGQFDHVVAMDSLIHYQTPDKLAALAGLAARTRRQILFTVAPRTPALTAMHMVGRIFPRGDRAPAIEPVSPASLRKRMAQAPGLSHWRQGRSHRISRGFYISQALELIAP